MQDTQYEDLLRHVLGTGTRKMDRTGTGTRSILHIALHGYDPHPAIRASVAV